jgi:formylmethanofuran dehydrogenase subunit E-like metal-binding protein
MRIKKTYISLDKIKHKNITSKYKIELSKSIVKKLYNKLITIKKENKSTEKLVDKINEKFTFEINI